MPEIGRLEEVDVRYIWPNEDKDFTPWVASAEGLRLLGEWVGLSLARGRSEVEIGKFRADVICDDVSDPRRTAEVVIENQLRPSDHDHLGKLLTYASVSEAGSGIWIATDFTPEHLAAVKAWNRPADRTISIYCVRVAAWRIGRSLAAPTFDVLVRPESQEMSTLRAAPITSIRSTRRRFWIELRHTIQARGLLASITSEYQGYQRFEIVDEVNPVACLSVARETSRNRARLYLRGRGHQEVFNRLEEDRTDIDKELGSRPEWIPGDEYSTVGFANGSYFFDESKWDQEIEWMITKLELLRRVFRPRLDAIRMGETEVSSPSQDARWSSASASG